MAAIIGISGLIGGLMLYGVLAKKTNINKYIPGWLVACFIMGLLTTILGWIFGVDMGIY